MAQSDAVTRAVSLSSESDRADIDSTTAPCQDFYQYAVGGWYRRTGGASGGFPIAGLYKERTVLDALRRLVAQAPTLAATTTDPALRVVGHLYGSCLADTSGLAEGAAGAGDAKRTSYCYGALQRYLERALFELLMEYVWPPAARAESRQLWSHMQAAAIDRVRNSTALSDSTKQQWSALIARQKLYPMLSGMDDSVRVTWPADPVRPRGVRGPSILPFGGPEVAATWVYRDYRGLTLSPTDFRGNVAWLEAAPDTIPLPAVPGIKEPPSTQQSLSSRPGSRPAWREGKVRFMEILGRFKLSLMVWGR